MYKIILVDDEELVIKSLMATVNWQDYGFEIIDYALSAEEAMDKVYKHNPDVVFTDIKMPKINGLELLQMIKSIKPDIYCMVISGYAEFAYIQKAIRLEAVGYCLKPFDEDEIGGYLKKFKERLDKIRVSENNTNCYLDYIQSTTSDALMNMERVYRDKGIDFTREKICAMYVIGSDKIEKLRTLFFIRSGNQKYICLIRYDWIEMIKNKIREEFTSSIHVGISKPITSIAKVAKAIREAKCYAFQFFCQEKIDSVTTSIESCCDMVLLQELERGMERGDIGEIHRHLEVISENFKLGIYNINYAIRIQNIYAAWLAKQNESDEVDLVYDYETLCEMYKNVIDLLEQMEKDSEERFSQNTIQNNISNKTFLLIFQYIEKNYIEQISIPDLAELFHVNPCYISQLFRKEIGCTFTDYLANKRIKYAGKLLVETDCKVNEIAEMSGFNDYFYFSRVFKKMKKCSPSEYRNSYRTIDKM